jgi:predicted nucleic acid-binding protein
MKFIVDTSAWIDHLRKPLPSLVTLLEEMNALTHSAVVGELAMGQIRNRAEFLGNLKLLPRAQEAGNEEILEFIEEMRLHGRGLSLGDAHILASALLSEAGILTRDQAMLSSMKNLGISHP